MNIHTYGGHGLKILAVAAAVLLALLSLFPREYSARAKLVPPQSAGAGLGSLLGGAGSLASLAPLLGSRQPTEVFLAVAKSHEVALEVVRRVGWVNQKSDANEDLRAVRKLRGVASINSLKGGLIEFQVTGSDSAEVLQVTGAYADVFGERLKKLSLLEASKKQELVQVQLQRASERLVRAQEAMRRFRISNRLVSPEGVVASAVNLSTSLRARLMAKEVELATLAKLVTPGSMQYQYVQSEIAELRARLASLEAESNKESLNFGKLSSDTSEYISLLRDQRYAEALFEVFSKYHETLLLEQASAGINAQVVEAPHLDPERPIRWAMIFAAALIVLFLLAPTLRKRLMGQPQ